MSNNCIDIDILQSRYELYYSQYRLYTYNQIIWADSGPYQKKIQHFVIYLFFFHSVEIYYCGQSGNLAERSSTHFDSRLLNRVKQEREKTSLSLVYCWYLVGLYKKSTREQTKARLRDQIGAWSIRIGNRHSFSSLVVTERRRKEEERRKNERIRRKKNRIQSRLCIYSTTYNT
jgi:hypothetical protein